MESHFFDEPRSVTRMCSKEYVFDAIRAKCRLRSSQIGIRKIDREYQVLTRSVFMIDADPHPPQGESWSELAPLRFVVLKESRSIKDY
jgi:hypothetical protein